MNPLKTARRFVGVLQRRLWDRFRGETDETYFSLHDVWRINDILRPHGVEELTLRPEIANESIERSTRYILSCMAIEPHLRKVPTDIQNGSAGWVAHWITSINPAPQITEKGTSNILSAFDSRPGERVKRIFELRQDLRDLFPLAMTPHPDRAKFLTWFVSNGRHEFDLTAEEGLWYLFERDELPDRGLVSSYCLQPQWQRDQPNALTPGGWNDFKAYIAAKFNLTKSRWLSQATLDAKSQQVPKPNELGANVLGHFRYASGLQEAAFGIVRGLQTANIPTSYRDLPVIFPCDWRDRERYQGLELYDTTLYVAAVNTFPDVWYPRCGLSKRDGVRRIAIWYWELEQVPDEWLPKLTWADEVWAPTRFIADAFRKAVRVPVIPMLPGVEVPKFAAKSRLELDLPTDRTLFLLSFDMGSVMARKNPLAVIAAFRSAFRADDAVHLVIKVSRGSSDPKSFALLQAAIAEVPNASLIDRVLTRDDALSLLQAADCYVSLHRSEGLGLGLAESMLMGKPVIATGYSGNLDFMTTDTAHLVDYKLVPIADDLSPYPKGCLWAEPSIAHAAGAMRAVFDRPDDANKLGLLAKQHVETVLSTSAAGERMAARLREIAALKSRTG